MAAPRDIVASTVILLALPASVPDARGESAAATARTPASASTSAAEEMQRFPPGCALAVHGRQGGARWYLPRASLVVVNRSPHRVALRMEARVGTEAGPTELGLLEAGEARTFPHAIPAGRSTVVARRDEDGAKQMRQPIYIWNYGPLTCQRRFVWVIR